MTIEQRGVVDIISVLPDEEVARLVIPDHLGGVAELRAHFVMIQEKVNDYLSFIESGELFNARPDLKDKRLVIQVVALEPPPPEALAFYEELRRVLADNGYPFLLEVRPNENA